MESKLVLVLGLVLVAGAVYYMHHQESASNEDTYYEEQFREWKLKTGKKYGGLEEQYRFEVFSSNLKFINDANAQNDSIVLALNDFADMTNEEFTALYLGLNRNQSNGEIYKAQGLVINEEIDWRTKGAVNPVRNQGTCGSCWAFSTVAALEGLSFTKNGQLLQLSEQELVDCAGGKYENQGCNGGWMDNAFQYVIDNGLSMLEDYQYAGVEGKCKINNDAKRFTLKAFKDVEHQSEAALLEALNKGPVSVAINASSFWLQFYHSGVFSRSCSTQLNHGVTAVGYGTEGNEDYYLVRNSWGSTWGDHGYIKFIRNGDGDGECGIQEAASFPSE